MIPQTTEDIREYMLACVLPLVDDAHEQDVTGGPALDEIEEGIASLRTMHENGLSQDWPIYLARLNSMATALLGHWERMHIYVMKAGVDFPDSDFMIDALKETREEDCSDANNPDQGD